MAAAVLLLAAADAAAQGRPYPSIFGGAVAGAPTGDRLELSLSLAEAYDTSVLAPDGGSGRPGLDVGGYFTALSADGRYAKRGGRAELVVNGGTNLRYFQDLGEVASVGHYLGSGVSLSLGPRTTLNLNEAISYRPSYLYGLFARTEAPAIGDVVPAASDYAVNNRESYSSLTTMALRRTIGRRASVDFSSGYQRTMFTDRSSSAPDVLAYHGAGRLSYPVSRNAALRLGYAYRHAEYAQQPRPAQHDIDLGIDYDRPLSRSRRTRIAFSAGSSLVEGPSPIQPTDGAVRQLRAVGNVLLTHQMGRTWSARAAYRRGSQFVEEFSAPVFTDAVTLTLDGFLNRRTDLATSVAYSAGDVVHAAKTAFETYTGNTRLRFGVTRKLALYTEYVFYYYDIAGAAPLASNVPARVTRHSARVGLMLWVPVIRK